MGNSSGATAAASAQASPVVSGTVTGQAGFVFGAVPGAVATTLNGALTTANQTIVVSSAAGFPTTSFSDQPTNFIVQVDSEQMLVNGTSGTTFTVVRGWSGTIASHSNGAAVTLIKAPPLFEYANITNSNCGNAPPYGTSFDLYANQSFDGSFASKFPLIFGCQSYGATNTAFRNWNPAGLATGDNGGINLRVPQLELDSYITLHDDLNGAQATFSLGNITAITYASPDSGYAANQTGIQVLIVSTNGKQQFFWGKADAGGVLQSNSFTVNQDGTGGSPLPTTSGDWGTSLLISTTQLAPVAVGSALNMAQAGGASNLVSNLVATDLANSHAYYYASNILVGSHTWQASMCSALSGGVCPAGNISQQTAGQILVYAGNTLATNPATPSKMCFDTLSYGTSPTAGVQRLCVGDGLMSVGTDSNTLADPGLGGADFLTYQLRPGGAAPPSGNGIAGLWTTAASGLFIKGQGSSFDLRVQGSAGDIFNVASGTKTMNFAGSITAGALDTAGTVASSLCLDSIGTFLSKTGGCGIGGVQTVGTGLGLSGTQASSNAVEHVSYQPGLLTAVNSTKAVFHKFSKAATVDNIAGSAATFSCVSNPTITMFECGTSATCSASPVTIGTVTVTAAGAVVDGTVSNPAIAAGDYVAFSMTAGTCASVDIAATAQVHSN